MLLARFRSLRNTALSGWLLLLVVARGMLAPGFMRRSGAMKRARRLLARR